ncbi:MerR family transcriptional regulator [Herbaspirillum sp. AP02]|uniref:MerR family transcriptional regulator n=1 Tax=unclassified Herbaspirillum TaxID=2624150 RepID=UPI0015DB27ED|nr:MULTISPECIES: MerR family transcriptional regulator [unclassified Herbaspirillum]MBG7619665.1 MerR family transcriptional regulator [Herbaspirillum sp. AP02]NZD69566.1 MerR family transcriptional regulator [Herbaspirillum sp. AP21]
MDHIAPQSDDLTDLPLLRPGAVARQLGMSVETLRAWEHRYGLTSSQHSGGGQRLYSQDDLQRLGWIKRLVDAGHRIGKLAALSPQDLEALALSLPATPGMALSTSPATPGATVPASMRLAVVGPWISTKAASEALARQHFTITAAVESLPQLDLRGLEGDMLVLESPVLDTDLDRRLDDLRRVPIQMPVLILYRFGSPEVVARLEQAGHRLLRKPMDGLDADWLGDQIKRIDLPAIAAASVGEGAVPLPRFSESDLAHISEASDRMQCECPRHLAELLTALAGFERYSRQCEDESEEEAALHRALCMAAGHARLPLEEALQRLAQVKGITLP